MMKSRGFTLIELAIVLVIITILIGGLAVPLSAQIQARRIAETKKILEEAREAIIGYAMSNRTNECKCLYKVDNTGEKPLPTLDTASTCQPLSRCQNPDPDSVVFQPDPNTLETLKLTITLEAGHHLPCPNLDGKGKEAPRVQGKCRDNKGYLPWVDLGVAPHDAWGNRLLYSVTDTYAHSVTGFPSSNGGDLQICSASANPLSDDCSKPGNEAGEPENEGGELDSQGDKPDIVAAKVPVVILSHGPNGWGALSIHNNTLKSPTSDDELENTNGNHNFVSRSPSRAGDAAGEFDDLVVWISDGLLRSRVCPSGGCP